MIQHAEIALAANESYPYPVSGDFIYVRKLQYGGGNAGSERRVDIAVLGQSVFPVFEGGKKFSFRRPFNALQISNPNAFSITIGFYTGFGEVGIVDSEPLGQRPQNWSVSAKTVAVPGVLEPLNATELFCDVLWIKAKVTNTDYILWGFDPVVAGFELVPGEVVKIDAPYASKIDANRVYIDAVVAGEGVKWMRQGTASGL